MKTSLFIPEKIVVGYDKREDTYTGKLAYIIYNDEKGKLRKEASWNNWRDKKINPDTFENIPTEGFVLNKNVGGYKSGWNHRQSAIRVYDPRGFEFEISLENLLYILEYSNSMKGKGLEGEFIYSWDGKDIVLLPCESSEYKEIKDYNELIRQNIKLTAKTIVIGATYKTDKLETLIYLGRYNYYEHENRYQDLLKPEIKTKDKGKTYHFYKPSTKSFVQISSLQRIKEVINEKADIQTSKYQELLFKKNYMYALDNENFKKVPVTAKLIKTHVLIPYNGSLHLYNEDLKAIYSIDFKKTSEYKNGFTHYVALELRELYIEKYTSYYGNKNREYVAKKLIFTSEKVELKDDNKANATIDIDKFLTNIESFLEKGRYAIEYNYINRNDESFIPKGSHYW